MRATVDCANFQMARRRRGARAPAGRSGGPVRWRCGRQFAVRRQASSREPSGLSASASGSRSSVLSRTTRRWRAERRSLRGHLRRGARGADRGTRRPPCSPAGAWPGGSPPPVPRGVPRPNSSTGPGGFDSGAGVRRPRGLRRQALGAERDQHDAADEADESRAGSIGASTGAAGFTRGVMEHLLSIGRPPSSRRTVPDARRTSAPRHPSRVGRGSRARQATIGDIAVGRRIPIAAPAGQRAPNRAMITRAAAPQVAAGVPGLSASAPPTRTAHGVSCPRDRGRRPATSGDRDRGTGPPNWLSTGGTSREGHVRPTNGHAECCAEGRGCRGRE